MDNPTSTFVSWEYIGSRGCYVEMNEQEIGIYAERYSTWFRRGVHESTPKSGQYLNRVVWLQ